MFININNVVINVKKINTIIIFIVIDNNIIRVILNNIYYILDIKYNYLFIDI